jgi:predicted secreted protein
MPACPKSCRRRARPLFRRALGLALLAALAASAVGASARAAEKDAIRETIRFRIDDRWNLFGGGSEGHFIAGTRLNVKTEWSSGLSSPAGRDWTEFPGFGLRRTASALDFSLDRGYGPRNAARLEVRREEGIDGRTRRRVAGILSLPLFRSLSLLGEFRHGDTESADSETVEERVEEKSLGLAYRPADGDRLTALARYTTRRARRTLLPGGSGTLRTATDTVSFDWSLGLGRHLKWVDHESLRTKVEEGDGIPGARTHSWLSINRLDWHVRPRIDLGLEYRVLRQKEAGSERKGFLAEITWAVARNVRLGAGYNFTDFTDAGFSDESHSVRGWFLRALATF